MTVKAHHIYWFAPYNLNGPSTRYRGKYPLDHLKKVYNIESDFVFPNTSPKGLAIFLKVFFSALFFRKKNSLIVIQKVCSNRLYANMLKCLILVRKQNTLYDLDDAEYLRTKTNTLHFFLRKCSSISVGSDILRDYCLNFNKNVHLQTSPIQNHKERKIKRNEKLTIGWVGDFGNGNEISIPFSHKLSLYKLFFSQVIKIKQPIKIILIGVKNQSDIPEIIAFFNKSPHIELEVPTDLHWENDDWIYPKIAEFDIGIAPMIDHPFTQAKSAFKAKQYLSAGIPVIASDVGENKKFVQHNFNGLLCKNEQDFLHAIEKFINMNEKDYNNMVNNCFKNQTSYSLDDYCETLNSIMIKNNLVI